MNKSALSDLITNKKVYLSKKDIDESIAEILLFMGDSLAIGNRIEIRGFGSFSSRVREARIARNPKTGKAIRVNSKYHPYFRASKSLKTSLKN
jgi:integration host factor subunit beta